MAGRFVACIRRIYLVVAVSMLVAGGLACGKTDAEGGLQGPTGAAAAGPSAADGKLAGLYIRQQMVPFFFNGRMTFNLQRDFFYFFPDGHMLFSPPSGGNLKEHPTAADFAEFKDVEPDKRGTYLVKDGQITFTPEKGKATTEPFSVPKAGDDSVLQIGPPSVVGSCKALPFKEGQKLDASYQYDGTVGQGAGITIFNVNTLNFRPDGMLGSDQLSGVDTKGIDTKVGNSGVTAGGTTSSGGTYKFSGYTLEKSIGGKTEKATVFRWAGDDKESAPGMMCIAGRVYSRIQPKK